MKKFNIIVLLFLISNFKALACLNGERYILKNQRLLYEDREDRLPFGHDFYTKRFEENIIILDSLYNKTKDIDYLSDKGLILILQKKYDEALKIYQFIEKTKPNRYSTASNMGTIYELIGDNQNALLWINKSIKINPKSHKNSEWLHAKILEAKIKGEKFYTGQFLLGTNFGNQEKPASNLGDDKLSKLRASLYYQLNERISFINPKDPIIAVLLFELGNIHLLENNLYEAHQIYLKAKEYGYNSNIMEARIALTKEKKAGIKKLQAVEGSNYLIMLSSIFLVVIFAAYIITQRTKRLRK